MSLFTQLFQRAAFAGLAFPFTEIAQTGANAVVENEQFLRNGAEVVFAGRKAYRGKFVAALFDNIEGYGNNLFPGTLVGLVRAFERQPEDFLAHPLLGTFRAVITSWEPKLSKEAQNGCFLEFEWIEQRAGVVGVVALDLDRGNGDPRAELAAQAATADAALSLAGVTPSKSLSTVAATALTKTATPQPYTETARAVASIEVAVDGARALLSAIAVTPSTALVLYMARAAVARVLVAAGRLRATLLPDPSKTTFVTTTRSQTFAELSFAVYGTPFRAADLRIANAIARDIVPAGRVIRVLP